MYQDKPQSGDNKRHCPASADGAGWLGLTVGGGVKSAALKVSVTVGGVAIVDSGNGVETDADDADGVDAGVDDTGGEETVGESAGEGDVTEVDADEVICDTEGLAGAVRLGVVGVLEAVTFTELPVAE